MEQEEDCQYLHELLSGNPNAAYECLSDIEALSQHWQECGKCHATLPDAPEQLKEIQNYALTQVRRNLEYLYTQHCSEADSILSPPKVTNFDPPPPIILTKPPKPEVWEIEAYTYVPKTASDFEKRYMQLLVLLAKKGENVREQLQVMNDNWGLDYFHVVAAYDSGEYDSQICGPFINSLPERLRCFVFQAILALDMLVNVGDHPYFLSDLAEAKFPPELGFIIYRTVERAAPEFVKRYLDEQKASLGEKVDESSAFAGQPRQALTPGNTEQTAERLDAIIAGQTTMFSMLERLPNRDTYNIEEITEDLVNSLGKDLFGKLGPESQKKLNKAEWWFKTTVALSLDEFRPSILDFYRAYELEFRRCISGPLVSKIIETGQTNYPAVDHPRQLVVKGKFNGKLGIGDQLWYLLNDVLVRAILSDFGFDVDEVHKTASRINRARRDAAHDGPCSRAEAERIRHALLGSESGLKTLFPQSAQGTR